MKNQNHDLRNAVIGFIVLFVLFLIAAHLEYVEQFNY